MFRKIKKITAATIAAAFLTMMGSTSPARAAEPINTAATTLEAYEALNAARAKVGSPPVLVSTQMNTALVGSLQRSGGRPDTSDFKRINDGLPGEPIWGGVAGTSVCGAFRGSKVTEVIADLVADPDLHFDADTLGRGDHVMGVAFAHHGDCLSGMMVAIYWEAGALQLERPSASRAALSKQVSQARSSYLRAKRAAKSSARSVKVARSSFAKAKRYATSPRATEATRSHYRAVRADYAKAKRTHRATVTHQRSAQKQYAAAKKATTVTRATAKATSTARSAKWAKAQAARTAKIAKGATAAMRKARRSLR